MLFFKTGDQEFIKIENTLKKPIILLMSFLTAVYSLVFGINAAISGQILLPVYDFFMFAASLAIGFWTLNSRELKKQPPLFCLNIFLFFLYLFGFGGFMGTGFIWSLMVPVTVFVIMGVRRSIFITSIYFAFCGLIVLFNGVYPGFFELPDGKWLIRGALIYIMTCVVSASYEYSQAKHQYLLKSEIEKRIGAQREAEHAKLRMELLESQQKYQVLFNAMQEGFAIHEIVCNENGEPLDYRFIDANKAFEEITSLKRADILNKTLHEVLPKAEDYWLENYADVAYTGKPMQFENYSVDLGKTFSVRAFSPEFGKFATIFYDITELKKLESSLHAEKELLRTTLLSVGDGVISTDKTGRIALMNDVAQSLTGWTIEEAVGRQYNELFRIYDEDASRELNNPLKTVLGTGEKINLSNHIMILTKNGEKKPIAQSAAPIIDKEGNIQGSVLIIRDVSEEKKKEREILYLSYHDELTGLYNRRYFEAKSMEIDLERELPLSVIIGDVNGLKLINDVFGHFKGDNMLRSAAGVIKDACRPGDVIARWGGDEFIMLLPQTSEKAAEEICKVIRINCEKHHCDDTIRPSISLGYATKVAAGQSLAGVMKTAEDYMYRYKLLESSSFRSNVVNSIKNTLYEKSHETEEHAERLKQLCRVTGEHLGLSQIELTELELFAMLHDIGKIAISDNILNKPGKLTDSEWREMKRHPEIGYRIAISSPELIHIADYIMSHHERWDGAGYPRGLSGAEIPMQARILALADSYDAMISDRPYRKAMSGQAAVEEIEKCAGSQFDPEVARIFIEKVLTTRGV